MSILEGLIRGSGQASNFIGTQQQRRIASEQAAREQTTFEQGQLADQLSASYVRGRDNNWITADPEKGRIGLSDTFKEQLASGDELAQNYAIELVNAGGRGKLPEGFKVDRINQGTDAEGNTVFYVGGINEDGSKGVITTDGTSNDDSIAKAFTPDELFNQTRLAFRSKDGVLYGQRVVDLNDYANSRELIMANTQNPILDGLGSNPAAQRQAAAVIANAATPEEEVEVTNLLAESVGVPPVQLPTEDTSKPETESAPTDNSAQIAKLEQDIAEIDGRKTAGRPANRRARAQKQRELNRLENQSQSGESEDTDAGRTRGERKFAPLPAIVEEQVAPVVEGKTIPEIDEAIDNGELRVDAETAAAAARDLQEQGVETAADLAKLDPRRQAFAYAMIVASTPNDGNRRAVRDQLINILETGVSDRGAEARQQDRLRLDQQKFIRQLRKDRDDLRKLNVPAIQEFTQELLDFNFDDEGRLTGDRKAFFNTANRLIPSIQAQTLLSESDPETAELLRRTGNQALGLVLQNMAASGNYGGAVDSFVAAFRPDVNNNINADLTGIDSDGELIFYGVRDGTDKDGKPTYRRQGEGVAITELRKINPDVANLLVKVAEDNMKARGYGG